MKCLLPFDTATLSKLSLVKTFHVIITPSHCVVAMPVFALSVILKVSMIIKWQVDITATLTRKESIVFVSLTQA